jgi:tRNA threonylcarbamoyladenosine biosynthesis protein TsaB
MTIVLGFDTATPSTAVGLRLADGSTLQARDDPASGAHPGHATRLLAMTQELLAEAGIGWSALTRIAVGVGPGTFTGLRVGVATARGLAQSLEVELVGVSSLWALAGPAGEAGDGAVLAAIDARRGEVFAAAYAVADPTGELTEVMSARTLPPADLGGVLAQAVGPHRAIGDGAVRYRDHLEIAGVVVPPDGSPLHRVSGRAICELGVRTATAARPDALLPDYLRRPDAELALEGAAR